MDKVSLLRLLCVAAVVFGLLEYTVYASSSGQHGDHQGKGPLRYSHEFSLNLQNSNSPIPDLDLPAEMNKNDDSVKVRKHKRGKKGGVRRRLKKTRTRSHHPSIILSHDRSLRRKAPNTTFDELQASVAFMSGFSFLIVC